MNWMVDWRRVVAKDWWFALARQWLALVRRWRAAPAPALTDLQQAQALVRAVDAGGLPLNPARVNAIARSLGLEVSTRAPVEETIERIRNALARVQA